ncbi:hypothetical protein [Bordetella phage vB_BbrM_PHB04]|uniref:Uncharacterized protein n=1 Tax=Bordetella phage vB_BbrM_PHB04 TaxID=2029657 RepID=A0A291L9Y2_9CAUD|nr:hypothetical protein HOS14_gp061 [Bordetella phage vB_BbrM_PHB04]ATI15679.1 hypothetical protein [Bordetella phage vB_BbrM_PHB04]
MIEFAQSAAPWVGYAWMLLSVVLALAVAVLVAASLLFRAVKSIVGLTIVMQALREWHKAHPETSRKWRRWFEGRE